MSRHVHVSSRTMSDYMRDISGEQLITIEEETRLADLIHNGTQAERTQAMNRLVCANLKLVVKLAHEFKFGAVAFDDLVAEGNLGLITAAEKFDPSKGAKFSCYAAWWIKQAMRHALMWQSKLIRVPGVSAAHMRSIDKATTDYFSENGKEPTTEELSEMTGIGTHTIDSLRGVAYETLYMEEQVNADSDTTFEEMMAEQDNGDDTRATCIDRVHDALEQLSDMDRFIITSTYGIDCKAVLDTKQIAQRTGLPTQEIKRRVDLIIGRMRGILSKISA